MDTDHLSIYAFAERAQNGLLSEKIRNSSEKVGTTVVCLEKELRGWLAFIKRKHDITQQIPAYERLLWSWEFFGNMTILPLDVAAMSPRPKLS